ncbi:DUF6611 family protein [Leifsonia poae]|uniref:DUF6611 family protein n=1 Tax=Leifsonia poae TaxID=110933 RepID=UPI0028525FC0|nr:DUF6611 family protein [Leifsonia poae]
MVLRLSEGRFLWGTLDVSPASRGVGQRVRLTVCPPGIREIYNDLPTDSMQ